MSRQRRARQDAIAKDRREKETGQYFPDHHTQTALQMDEANLTVVENRSYLYSRDVDAGEKVARTIDFFRDFIENAPPTTINWNDTHAVRETLLCYLDSCSRVGAMPSKKGLALAFGCDESTMKNFIRKHQTHPTAKLINMALDSFSEALAQSALNGSVQPIYAMFTQKSSYGVRENEPLEPAAQDPLGDITDTESLSRKYEDLVIDE